MSTEFGEVKKADINDFISVRSAKPEHSLENKNILEILCLFILQYVSNNGMLLKSIWSFSFLTYQTDLLLGVGI